MKNTRKWQKNVLTLKPNHTWKATPGYCVLVIQRGLMQFEYPSGWIPIPGDTSIKIHERKPPKDDIVLEVTATMLPPTAWERVPMERMLQESILNVVHELVEDDKIIRVDRPDLELVWTEYRKMEIDPAYVPTERMTVWRQAFCHFNDAMAFITYGFWEGFEYKADPIWKHFLNSIIMDRPVEDPTAGPRLH